MVRQNVRAMERAGTTCVNWRTSTAEELHNQRRSPVSESQVL
jgi:hypothetical protein